MGMKWLSEFKAFALKGNMIDLAVAVIIGGAFGKVIDSLVKHVMMPAIAAVTPEPDFAKWTMGPILIGEFANTLFNFLIVALAIFIVVNKVMGAVLKKPEAPAPATKDCPRCLMAVPVKATKCGHCTSDIG